MALLRTLNGSELSEAIALWLKQHGEQATGRVVFTVSPGDRPGEGPTVSASVEVEHAPQPTQSGRYDV